MTARAGARLHRPRLAQLLTLSVALAACDRGPPRGGPPADPAPAVDSAQPLRRVSLSRIPVGPPGDSIRRGRALLLNTHDSLPAHAPSPRIRCQSCHLDEGQRPNAGPWIGVSARYPQYRARAGRLVTIADRVNECLTRSLNGRPLPQDGREMRDIVAYLAFLSRGYPAGARVAGQGMPRLAAQAPDTARGRAVYAGECARCHADGLGNAVAPALWGPQSYNIGAGMARLHTAAGFVRHNMPYDRPGTLTDQQAYDVAAYVNAQPRPDFAAKSRDWPRGGAPEDVPYRTAARAVESAPRRQP